MKYDNMKNLIEENFKKMSMMPVEEYTLYRKWEEINLKKWSNKDLNKIWEIKNSLWIPENYDDYLKLEPEVIQASTPITNKIWTILRIFSSTLYWNASPGRLLRFYIQDKITKKYLGVISVGSDFISLGGRDNYIGWTIKQRLEEKMLKHTAMGSSIVPTQPLGYNYVGGKLIALLTASNVVENAWDKRYGDKLVSISTTSVYGGLSQYNRLKYWRKCKSTEGKIPLEPSDNVYKEIRKWINKNYLKQVKELQTKSHPKTRLLQFVYKQLKVKPPINNFSRGVYFCGLFNDTNKFLSKKVDNPGERKFDNSVESLTELWKERYAKKRIENVIKTNRQNKDILFYDDMIGISWDKAKEIYLKDVGR